MWQITDKILSIYINAIFLMSVVIVFEKIVLNEKIKISKTNLIIASLLASLIHLITFFNITGTLKTLVMFITNTLFHKYVYKTSNKKSIVLIFMCTTLLMISDLLSLFLIIEVLGFSKSFCYEEIAGSVISNLTVFIIIITLTYITRRGLRKIIKYELDYNKKIITLSIFTLISVVLFFYTIIKEFRFNDNVIIYLIAIVVLLTVLFSLIKQTIENKKITNEYDKLLEFMTTYEQEIEKQRILRHEIKNEFRTIRAKICDNQENKEIIEYIDEIVNDKYEIDKEKYAKFGYLPPNGIKGLCYFKTQEAEDKGIKVSLSISTKIKNSTIYNLTIKEQRDFGRILGVYLDNAIEASKESKEKQIGIEAYANSNKEFKMIITNTYNNEIDRTKIGIENFSTKGKNRGHGLLLVKQLVDKNQNLNLKTEIRENLYIQTIEIKKL